MWIAHDITQCNLDRATAVTIGAFDGVHRGHKALISGMVTHARQQEVQPLVITFDPLPGQVLGAGSYTLLSTVEERIARIRALDVAGIVLLSFDQALMATSAATFVSQMVQHLALSSLWVGPDFTLGSDRQGDIPFLKDSGARLRFEVRVLRRTVLWDGKPVRSSRIRRALKTGHIQEANGCLGYAYRISGVVIHGAKRGRKLGFPTANLEIAEDRLIPANGVYVCRATLNTRSYAAITNVGTRPTFNGHPPSVEAHLLDFCNDIYGASMNLTFLKRLRPELRFASAGDLIKQMHRDEATARAWLSRHASSTDNS